MKMLRQQIIRWLIYILVWGLLFPGIDNFAHLGGLITGFLLGRLMMDRPPLSPEERKRAYLLGWSAALIVASELRNDGLRESSRCPGAPKRLS
jgi:membrane associated rhomboid family serine protease